MKISTFYKIILTNTERKTLDCLAEGMSVPDIAKKLYRSKRHIEIVIRVIRVKISGEDDNGKPNISKDELMYYYGLMKGKVEEKTTDIIMPPGTYFSKIIGFIYSKKSKERIFDPIISDMHQEYFEALDQGRKWKMHWIHIRGIMNILIATIYDLPFFVLDKIINILKIS